VLNITITQLGYVVALDTYRHFGKAADKSFVTQPTLSAQIQKIEHELGVTIFDRSKTPVEPTGIGKIIIEQARIILKESQKIPELIKIHQGAVEGEFRLGVIPTIAPSLLPLFLRPFAKKYPKVELIIEELQTGQIIDRLKKDTLDAGILATPLDEQGIQEKPLYYEPFVAYFPPNHKLLTKKKVAPDDLTPSDVLLLSEGHCFRNQLIKLCALNTDSEPKQVRFESGNFDTLKKLVEQGFGLTLMPLLKTSDFPKHDLKSMREFISPAPVREVSLVHSRTALKKHLLDLLAEEIKETVPKELLKKGSGVTVEPFG
jgi:LysR family transcriptional regulator, hydrogen peroxide-inducible genes activator